MCIRPWLRSVAAYCVVAVAIASVTPAQSEDLARGFAHPPASARPWVYWFWLNGNITREGITADLEAMKHAGIGGVLIMEVDQGAPLGPVSFASDRWRELFRHVVSEADRLGLKVNMNNDAGWCGSGGPWITPNVAMQRLVWTETPATGSTTFDGTLPQAPSVVGYYRDVAVLAYPTPDVEYRVENLPGLSGVVRQDAASPAEWPALPEDKVVSASTVVNLTSHMGPDGHLTWTVPPGNWTIVRFGHTPTGAVNSPSPASGRGLECDKLSPAGADAQFAGLMGKLIADSRPLAGKSLVATHIDSWEMGSQNWTPLFASEFRARRGYDMLPWLPVMTGRVVGSPAQSQRFLWDVRQTISELLVDNYAGRMRELARRVGMHLTIEAYGDCVFDNMAYAARADEPMGEFWSWPKFGASTTLIEMSSAAHVYGKPIVGAEAFTADAGERWLGYPGSIKALGDWAFCQGINRFVFHRYAMQPWLHQKPGMSMGPWGLHYECTQTWWKMSPAWHQYLSRCQYLLQRGLPVVDVLCLQPEGAPRSFNPPASILRAGYHADGCTPEALLKRISVRSGRLVTPEGMSYRALVLPASETMTPTLLKRIRDLAKAGALILGSAPKASPSLAGYPACDNEVREIAGALWSAGTIRSNISVEKALAARGVPPDMRAGRVLNWIHKRIGGVDVYLVANPTSHPITTVCEFRIAGRTPELWRADTGEIALSALFDVRRGTTRVPIHLDPAGSVFVVFRKPIDRSLQIVSVKRNGREIAWPDSKAGTITVLKAQWGPAGDSAHTKDVTDQVQRKLAHGVTSFTVAELASEGDPALNVVKTLRVQYSTGGRKAEAAATDPEEIVFDVPAERDLGAQITISPDGRLAIRTAAPGAYILTTASGKRLNVSRAAAPKPIAVGGPWDLRFAPGGGAPAQIKLPQLISWSKHTDPRVRAFSGTATYRTAFHIPATVLSSATRWLLDLGDVQVMARIRVNSRDLGTLWKPPYSIDVTSALKPGANALEVSVVNLWPNRMIADEALPEDSDRNPDGTLRSWPAWLTTDQPSPTGRFTFTSWRIWKKDAPLLSSGLIGPVRITAVRQALAKPVSR